MKRGKRKERLREINERNSKIDKGRRRERGREREKKEGRGGKRVIFFHPKYFIHPNFLSISLRGNVQTPSILIYSYYLSISLFIHLLIHLSSYLSISLSISNSLLSFFLLPSFSSSYHLSSSFRVLHRKSIRARSR